SNCRHGQRHRYVFAPSRHRARPGDRGTASTDLAGRLARDHAPDRGASRRADPLHRPRLGPDRAADRADRAMNRWLLPQAISDLLPPRAQALEDLRRAILDCYRGCGYELVIPPLIEYLDSLLIG